MTVEAITIAVLAGHFGLNRTDALASSVGINGLTQPILYQALPIMPAAGGDHWWVPFLTAEVVVSLAEAGLYIVFLRMPLSASSIARTLTLSVLANGFSAALGLLLPF